MTFTTCDRCRTSFETTNETAAHHHATRLMGGTPLLCPQCTSRHVRRNSYRCDNDECLNVVWSASDLRIYGTCKCGNGFLRRYEA